MSTHINLNGIHELDLALPGSTTASVSHGVVTVTNEKPIDLQTNGVDNGSQTKLNLVQGSNVTITDDGTGDITIAASGGGGGISLLKFWNPPQSLVVGNGTGFQTLISYTIPANTIPANGAVRLTFLTLSSSVTSGSNTFQVTLGSSSANWDTSTSIPTASATVVISNLGVTNSQAASLYPLLVTPSAAGFPLPGFSTTWSEDTTTPLVITVAWNGPVTQSTQVLQASLELLS